MRLSNPLFLASIGVLFVSASCTLITDVDRSKIMDDVPGEGGTPSVGGSVSNPPADNGGAGATSALGGAGGAGGAGGEPMATPSAGAPNQGGTGAVEPSGGAGAGGAPAPGDAGAGTGGALLGASGADNVP